jgi:hypothetical protein
MPNRWAVHLLAGAALAAIVALFAFRCGSVAWTDSITSDETTHLVHSLHFWMTGDDLSMWELGAPRLPHIGYGLASYLVLRGEGLLTQTPTEEALTALVVSGDSRVLEPARGVAVAWGVGLLLATYWVAARVGGTGVGLIAAGLLSMVPDCLAHSAIAGSDIPFTTAAVLALGLLARFADRPTWGRWWAAALMIGAAWAMRHSAVILIPVAGVVHMTTRLRRGTDETPSPLFDRVLASTLATIGLGLVAGMVLWAGDGFQTVSLAEVSEKVTALNIPTRLGPIDVSGWRLPSSALSLLKQVRHQAQGHEAFFCGSLGTQGWPTYFPVAFLLKTPIGLLALLVLAAVRIRPRGAWDAIALACLGVLWLTLVRNRVNIGVRYAFLTYPIAVTFVARLFRPGMLRDRVWGPVTVLAALGFVGASLAGHPRYLSYFNEIGGGPEKGWLYLADSNVDWGQDLQALADALPGLGLDEITYDVSSERPLDLPGIVTIRNPPHSAQFPAETPRNRRIPDGEGGSIPIFTRYVAVSVSRLYGLYSQNDMSWLRSRRLVSRIGDSIFVFDMDRPAEHDLWR